MQNYAKFTTRCHLWYNRKKGDLLNEKESRENR